MANAKSRSLGPGLSTAEQVAGFCYLPFFVVLLSMGVSCVFTFVPGLNRVSTGFVIIITAVLVSALAAVLRPIPEEEEDMP